MSNLRQCNGDDHPIAARKHLQDALILHSNARYDGAGYLAGYVVECVLKTLLLVESKPRMGHNLSTLSSEAQQLASLPSAKTAKYVRGPAKISLTYGSLPTAPGVLPTCWNEALRYREENLISVDLATQWISDAQGLYDGTVGEMIRDGVVTL